MIFLHIPGIRTILGEIFMNIASNEKKSIIKKNQMKGEGAAMKNMTEQIKARRSVRTYDGGIIDESIKEKLESFWNTIENPFDIPVEFRFLNAKEHGLLCPVVSGTELYVGGKIKSVPNASIAFGYSFEAFVLYAQSIGLGTVWLGGTMNRGAFEKAMELGEDEMMPCASPIGYAAKKMSVRENMMRKAIKADERMAFEELFYDDTFDKPLTRKKAGNLEILLDMVRLAPSAVNKQPWRVCVAENVVHFYLKRSKGVRKEGKLDMQMVDMGIALCHFALTAKEYGFLIEFIKREPQLLADNMEYIGSYRIL